MTKNKNHVPGILGVEKSGEHWLIHMDDNSSELVSVKQLHQRKILPHPYSDLAKQAIKLVESHAHGDK